METMMKVCNDSKVANTNASIEANINAYGPVPDYKAFTDFVVNQLKNKNNKVYKGIHIDKVKLIDFGYDIPIIGFELHNKIAYYTYDNNGEYVLGNISVKCVTINSLITILRQNKDVNINEIITNPEVLENILTEATIDILQIPVRCGDTFVSPFTNRETLYDKDMMINIIIDIHLNK